MCRVLGSVVVEGGGVDNPDYYARFGHLQSGALDAKFFNFIGCCAKSGGVNETIEYAVYFCRVFNDVASRARNVTNDCFVIT